MKELYKENLWNKIHEEINSLKNDESMKGFYKKNVLDLIKNSDLVIIHTEWEEFKALDFKKLYKKLIFLLDKILFPLKS